MLSPGYIAYFVGALVATFLVSRLFLWFMRSWDGGISKLLLANASSLTVATLLGGLGKADGGDFRPIEAFVDYVLPQTTWLAVDLLNHYRRPKPKGDALLARAVREAESRRRLTKVERHKRGFVRLGTLALIITVLVAMVAAGDLITGLLIGILLGLGAMFATIVLGWVVRGFWDDEEDSGSPV